MKDPWAIPAFLDRRNESPLRATERQRAIETAQNLAFDSRPVAPAGTVSKIRRARARISERHGRWYYTIRGGYTGGPFTSEKECRAAAKAAVRAR